LARWQGQLTVQHDSWSFKQFPKTKWTLQVPLARKNVKNGIEFAKACVNSMGPGNLYAMEIGNEPNLYVPQHHRPASYGPAEYAKEFKQYASDLLNDAFLGGHETQDKVLDDPSHNATTGEDGADGELPGDEKDGNENLSAAIKFQALDFASRTKGEWTA
jgi:hypothetical protein